jgi:hypothetical protein
LSRPLGISDRHLRALGSLVVQSGLLEQVVLDFAICRAGLSRMIGNVLMGRDNFDAMLSRLCRLVAAADNVDTATKRRFRGWSKQAESAMRRRNDLLPRPGSRLRSRTACSFGPSDRERQRT